MTLDPDTLKALTIIIVAAIAAIAITAVLAPAALATFIKPLLDTINKLIDALAKRPPTDPPPPPRE